MRRIQNNYSLSFAEKFFLERGAELLHPETIDSYRVRLHNPKTILIELIHVINSLNSGKIKNKKYAIFLIKELEDFISNDVGELEFYSITSEFLKKIIKNITKENKENFITQIGYLAKLLLKDNEQYALKLFDKIINLINKINEATATEPPIKEIEKLDRLTSYLFSELISIGYSKVYLQNYFRMIFSNNFTANSFTYRLNIIKQLAIKSKEVFTIIIAVKVSETIKRNLTFPIDGFELLTNSERQKIISKAKDSKVKNFFTRDNRMTMILKNEIETLDYYSAGVMIRNNISAILDRINISSPKDKFDIQHDFVVIGEKDISKSSIQYLDYQLDGNYNASQEVTRVFDETYNTIKEKVSKEAIDKIRAGIRYFRLGNQSSELNTKLLHYWIGIEYIFSADDENPMARIERFYKKCHSTIFFKRLLVNFHHSIKYLELDNLISNYDENLNYLKESTSYDIFLNQTTSPLLAYRSYFFKEGLSDRKKIKEHIVKHYNNIERNLWRIYRIRNEIVHEASDQSHINTITSHLKYYLFFILFSLIDFFSKNQIDINDDGIFDIEDYFHIQELLADDYWENGAIFDAILKVSYPLDLTL